MSKIRKLGKQKSRSIPPLTPSKGPYLPLRNAPIGSYRLKAGPMFTKSPHSYRLMPGFMFLLLLLGRGTGVGDGKRRQEKTRQRRWTKDAVASEGPDEGGGQRRRHTKENSKFTISAFHNTEKNKYVSLVVQFIFTTSHVCFLEPQHFSNFSRLGFHLGTLKHVKLCQNNFI